MEKGYDRMKVKKSEHFCSENIKPEAKRLFLRTFECQETSWLQIPVISLMLEQARIKQSQAEFKLRSMLSHVFLIYMSSHEKKNIPRCEELQNHFMMTYSLDTCILVTLGGIQHLRLWRLHLLFG